MRSSLKALTLVALALALIMSGCEGLPPLPPLLENTPVPSPTPAPTPTATPVPTPVPTSTPLLPPAPPLSPLPSVTKVAEKLRPAVVSIQVETLTPGFFLQPVPQQGAGSGVVIDPQGYIVTNNHVIEDARSIKVSLPDGRNFDGRLVGRDPLTDLAVIKIEGNDLPVASLGDSSRLQVGEWVVAIGNALALEGGPTVTAGVVGALGRSITEPDGVIIRDLIQTDAAINPGNSGGPLANLAGEVIGINTAIASQAQGIGFSISIDTAKPVIQELIAKGKIARPWLGIQYVAITPSSASRFNLPVTKGILILQVVRGTPASAAGLQEGDVVVSFAGRKIDDDNDLRQAIQAQKPGDRVEIALIRDRVQKIITAVLGESPAPR